MADYYNLQQLSQRAKVSESEIRQLQEAGFLSPITKNGRLFFSSQQARLCPASATNPFNSRTGSPPFRPPRV